MASAPRPTRCWRLSPETIRFLEEVDLKLREGKAELRTVGKVMMYG
jgi:hypothetical protein